MQRINTLVEVLIRSYALCLLLFFAFFPKNTTAQFCPDNLMLKPSLTFNSLPANLWFRLKSVVLGNGTANPLEASAGFGIFVEKDATFIGGESQGPVAIGGDLFINGTYRLASQESGSFVAAGDNQTTALLVGNKIKYISGSGITIPLAANVKVGDLSGTSVWTDQNGSLVNFRLTNGAYSNTPSIQGANFQTSSSIGPQSPLDFAAAFVQLKQNSAALAANGANVSIQNTGSGSGTIALQSNQINMLNVTGAELKDYTEWNFPNKPAINRPLTINVDASGTLEWTPPVFTDFNDTHGIYVIWNFHNASALQINGATAVYGAILAPKADIVKNGTGNINGQIIGQRYHQSSGSVVLKTYQCPLRYFECVTPCKVISNTIKINATQPTTSVIFGTTNQICSGNDFVGIRVALSR